MYRVLDKRLCGPQTATTVTRTRRFSGGSCSRNSRVVIVKCLCGQKTANRGGVCTRCLGGPK